MKGPLVSSSFFSGVNIGGAGSYIYDKPQTEGQVPPGPIEHVSKVEEKKVSSAPRGPSKGMSCDAQRLEISMATEIGNGEGF